MPYFYQYEQKNKKGWDTGRLNYHLAQISSNEKITKGNKTSKLRAQHLLNLRKNYRLVPPPAYGHALISVEDDLAHQIREFLVITYVGVNTSFFRNPSVKALPQSLDNWKQTTYWLKNMRIICFINYVLTEDIYLFMTENLLKYETSFVALTSDFWGDRVRKKSFGVCIGNFMDNRYKFKNRLSIFVLDTTMKFIYKDVLRYPNPTLSCCQALFDFIHFRKYHTEESFGNWLYAIHKGVGYKPDFIGSHVVDSAYNPGKYVDVLEWKTQGEHPQKIVTSKCDSHTSNTLATQASGKSGHKHNMKPGFDVSPSKLQSIIVNMERLGTRMKVYDDVQNEHRCKKFQTLDFAVQTLWNPAHIETMCGA